jgi:hypothetical protein
VPSFPAYTYFVSRPVSYVGAGVCSVVAVVLSVCTAEVSYYGGFKRFDHLLFVHVLQ